MNKKIRNIATLMVLAFAGTSIATAQVSQQKIGQNPMTINPNAVLDIESNNKGLLLPRLALTATDNVAPLTAHVAGMTVYNTATNGDDETAVTPGYYYNDGTQWVRIVSSADMKTEPWYNQDTNTEATENTQNIYQMGKVAIGRDETVAGARLDVAGNVTVGEGNTFLNDIEGLNSLAVGMGNHVGVRGLVVGNDNTVTGVNSFAVGSENEVTGPNSIAMGAGSNATGTNSIAIGNYATASAANSVVLGGSNNTSSGLNAFSGGSSAVANGDNATAFGLNVTASSFAEIVLGKYNAITTGTVSSAVNTDPLFQIGNGLNDTGRANALTILKNGNVGIANEAIAPTERVDVGSGNVRVRDINTVAGTTTDKIVVADTDGVLKTITVASITPDAVDANNGLTKTASDIIQLGGDLIKDTKITLDENELEIDAADSDLIISGLDKTKVQATVNDGTTTGITQHLLAVDADNNVTALKAAMPKFFYMPSIIIPTSEAQMADPVYGGLTGDSFDDSALEGTIDLYARYNAQFGTTGTATQPSSPGAPELPVLPASELHYYITWYDTTVFSSVAVDANGVMTYELLPTADVTMGSFMNIVFAVKEDN